MRNDSDRLQWQTEKNYIMNTFHNGLRRIQTDSKTAQQLPERPTGNITAA